MKPGTRPPQAARAITSSRHTLALCSSAAVRLGSGVLAAAAISLLNAGCGDGANGPSVASLGATTSTVRQVTESGSTPNHPTSDATTAALVRFADCMNKRGYQATVGRGGHGVSIVGTFDQSSPAFISAQRACQKLLPGGTSSASSVYRRRQHFFAVAECMRRQGFPSFPNPNSQGQLLISPNQGLDSNSPQFAKAIEACGAG